MIVLLCQRITPSAEGWSPVDPSNRRPVNQGMFSPARHSRLNSCEHSSSISSYFTWSQFSPQSSAFPRVAAVLVISNLPYHSSVLSTFSVTRGSRILNVPCNSKLSHCSGPLLFPVGLAFPEVPEFPMFLILGLQLHQDHRVHLSSP